MSTQYGELRPLAAEIVSLVWGTPGNFNGFRVLAALLHGTLVVDVSQTAAFNRGHHLYSAGRPWRWALAHISSICTYFYIAYIHCDVKEHSLLLVQFSGTICHILYDRWTIWLLLSAMWRNFLVADVIYRYRCRSKVRFSIGTCESFFCVRIKSRIGRPIRFRIEFSNRIGRIYHASRNTV